jgi:hypothetical protein
MMSANRTVYLYHHFTRATSVERVYSRAMAETGAPPHRSSDIVRNWKTGLVAVSFLREGLMTKGLIYSPYRGDDIFTVPLFAEHLHRCIPFKSMNHWND